jgi:hypothetical protein
MTVSCGTAADDALVSTNYLADGSIVYSFKSPVSTNTAVAVWSVPYGGTADVLAVGGGGGGGSQGGGGGAGGFIYRQGVNFAAGEMYSVVVGGGGEGGKYTSQFASSGIGKPGAVTCVSNVATSVELVCALGGGYGGARGVVGGDGGSGGGAGAARGATADGVITASGVGTNGQGYDGGNGYGYYATTSNPQSQSGAGGGGGAGGPGYGGQTNAVENIEWYSCGGHGVTNDITGTPVVYAAGGSGANRHYSQDGIGGMGGIGTATSATGRAGTAGAADTGSGGGGGAIETTGYSTSVAGVGGSGGSGIVIIRFHPSGIFRDGAKNAGTGGDSVRRIQENGTNYMIHVFTATTGGTFSIDESVKVDILVVGGGGGGGCQGGGGGAGGVVYSRNVCLCAGNYTVNVGAGGAGGERNGSNGNPGISGGDSSITNMTFICAVAHALGGGGGGGRATDGISGGSGGGAGAARSVDGNIYNGGIGVEGQGFAGGDAYSYKATSEAPQLQSGAGGGGGAGGPGYGGNTNVVEEWYSCGGHGVTNDITGTPVVYAAGGSGANRAHSQDGVGGMGGYYIASGNSQSATAGAANTGSGGGGGSIGTVGWTSVYGKGGAGADGIVVIRYALRRRGFNMSIR